MESSHKVLPMSMSFNSALVALKQGYKVARAEWKDSLVVFLPKEDKYPHLHKQSFYIVPTSVSDGFVEWPPSAYDLLADDWYIL